MSPMTVSRSKFVLVLISSCLCKLMVQYVPCSVKRLAGKDLRTWVTHHFPSFACSGCVSETWATPPLAFANRRSSSNDLSHAASRKSKSNPI